MRSIYLMHLPPIIDVMELGIRSACVFLFVFLPGITREGYLYTYRVMNGTKTWFVNIYIRIFDF